MIAQRSIVLLVLLTSACTVPPAPKPQPSISWQPVPQDLAESVRRSERIGREIFVQDRAAWRATDLVKARDSAWNSSGAIGWITVAHGDERRVRFLTQGESNVYYSRYDVDLGASENFVRHDPAAPLSSEEQALARARALGIASMQRRCSETYNTAIVLDAERNEILVYLMPASFDTKDIVLAGYDLARISADGLRLVEWVPLSKGCLIQKPERDNPVGLYVNHILHPYPIETHVFTNLAAGLPLVVGTSRGYWGIENGHIKWGGEREGLASRARF